MLPKNIFWFSHASSLNLTHSEQNITLGQSLMLRYICTTFNLAVHVCASIIICLVLLYCNSINNNHFTLNN